MGRPGCQVKDFKVYSLCNSELLENFEEESDVIKRLGGRMVRHVLYPGCCVQFYMLTK